MTSQFSNYEGPKYYTDVAGLKSMIQKYGVAIIPSVLTNEECNQMRKGMWDGIGQITQTMDVPIKEDQPESWRTFYELLPKHSMLVQQWQIGHCQYVWNCRQNPKIVQIFADFWGVKPDQLLTSFDGVSIHPPPEQTNKGYNRGKLWLHTDQSYLRNEFECLQSWVTSENVEQGDATLAFLEGSNQYHQECGQQFQLTAKEDWTLLDEPQLEFYKTTKKCPLKYISAPFGSVVFWDSRTIHCGTESFKGRPNPKFRNVVYICMVPRKYQTESGKEYVVSEKILQKRIKAFAEHRMTSHWPHLVRLFPKIPQTYGRPLPKISPVPTPNLTELGMKLVGN